ncbi:MAG: DUF262 domain-containing protein [Rhodoferax sp.]|uniref:DUF262 domain-containing protein n=1 Tax=Rhodoferax sp. TaxID=50421 RepID=UPI003BAF9672
MENVTIDEALSIEDGLDQEEERDDERDAINTPFDPKQVEITARKFTISALLERLKHDELELNPDFQRRANLWDEKRKSRLIESILLRIPLPSFYFREDENGNFSVVDGLQRLCTIFHFVDYAQLNRATGSKLVPLRLNGLQYLKDIEDNDFEELDRTFKRRINELEIEANVIRASTPKEVMFNVFARLNQGGLPLSPQEIRNAIFPGEWRNEIRRLSESKEFKKATGNRIPTERQQDMEMVLRFIALWALEPRGQREPNQILDKFLNDTVEKSLNTWNSKIWIEAQQAFFNTLETSVSIFGRHAFRKSYGINALKPVNKGVFEAQLIALSQLSKDQVEILIKKKNEVCEKFGIEIQNVDSRLSKALRSGTGHAESSNARIAELSKIFKDVLSV